MLEILYTPYADEFPWTETKKIPDLEKKIKTYFSQKSPNKKATAACYKKKIIQKPCIKRTKKN